MANEGSKGGLKSGSKETKVSELEELSYARQVYQNQYTFVSNSAQVVMQEMRELSASQHTMENIGMLTGKESLLSTGAGVYIRALPSDTTKVLVEVGGRYVVEKTIDEAKAFLGKQIEIKTGVMNKLLKSKREIEAALMDIEYKLDSSGMQV
jgi:prefoldin alpha subunit